MIYDLYCKFFSDDSKIMEKYEDAITHIKILGSDAHRYDNDLLTNLFSTQQYYGSKWIRQNGRLSPKNPLPINKERTKHNLVTAFPTDILRNLLSNGSRLLLQKLGKVNSSFALKIGLFCRHLVVGKEYIPNVPNSLTTFNRSFLYLNQEDYKEPWLEKLHVYESIQLNGLKLKNLDCMNKMIEIASKSPLMILTINGCYIPSNIKLLASELIVFADFGQSDYDTQNGSITDFFDWFPNAIHLK